MKYQIYEDRTTYLLEIDHEKKTFAVGSFKGRPERKIPFQPIDITAYKNEISKIRADYKCTSNALAI